ncbi:hypothetical protein HG530_010939 [Fusarium avenaceum]|nr:hypothetical protein HG530_010939 [Fusarium avenaceum]
MSLLQKGKQQANSNTSGHKPAGLKCTTSRIIFRLSRFISNNKLRLVALHRSVIGLSIPTVSVKASLACIRDDFVRLPPAPAHNSTSDTSRPLLVNGAVSLSGSVQRIEDDVVTLRDGVGHVKCRDVAVRSRMERDILQILSAINQCQLMLLVVAALARGVPAIEGVRCVLSNVLIILIQANQDTFNCLDYNLGDVVLFANFGDVVKKKLVEQRRRCAHDKADLIKAACIRNGREGIRRTSLRGIDELVRQSAAPVVGESGIPSLILLVNSIAQVGPILSSIQNIDARAFGTFEDGALKSPDFGAFLQVGDCGEVVGKNGAHEPTATGKTSKLPLGEFGRARISTELRIASRGAKAVPSEAAMAVLLKESVKAKSPSIITSQIVLTLDY